MTRDLRRWSAGDPTRYLAAYLASRKGLRRFAGEAPINTDTRPYVEYHPATQTERYAEAARNLEALLEVRSAPRGASGPLRQLHEARGQLLRAAVS